MKRIYTTGGCGALAEKAGAYYTEENMNCAESVIHGANDYYHLQLNEHTLRTAAGFGGGLCIGNVCGALSGGVMALSVLFVEERAHESAVIDLVVSEYLSEAESRYGSIMCVDLKQTLPTDDEGCRRVVEAASDLLETIVNKYSDLRVDVPQSC